MRTLSWSPGGWPPGDQDKVRIHYTGWTTDGTLFDSSYSSGFPVEFGLTPGRLIAGWIEGVPLMREGAIYLFQLPPALGYGERGSPPTIGPNATLVFNGIGGVQVTPASLERAIRMSA